VGESKYEREIRSLLDGLDDFLPDETQRAPGAAQSQRPAAPLRFRKRSPLDSWTEQAGAFALWLVRYPFFAAALSIAVGAVLVRPIFGGHAALPFGIAAGGFLVLLFVRVIRHAMYGQPYERRWRGQLIDPPLGHGYEALVQWWQRTLGRGRR